MNKKCPHCKQIKPLSNFYKRKSGSKLWELYHSWCKDCTNVQTCKKYQAGELKAASPRTRFKKYKRSAKYRDLKWDLTFKQFKSFWQKPCYYCGAQIDFIRLDRIDNLKGYTVKNVVSCCWKCNQFKCKFSQKEFLQHCITIANFNSKKR